LDLNEDGEGEDHVVTDITSERYKILKEEEEKKLKGARKEARSNGNYKKMVKEMATLANNDQQTDHENIEEQKRKRRKLLKSFKEYTTKQDNEGRFKGWSFRAAEDMAEMVTAIQKDSARYRRFNQAYREVYHKRFDKKGNNNGGSSEKEFVPDYNKLWSFSEITDQDKV
jgi:hypothetical protein